MRDNEAQPSRAPDRDGRQTSALREAVRHVADLSERDRVALSLLLRGDPRRDGR